VFHLLALEGDMKPVFAEIYSAREGSYSWSVICNGPGHDRTGNCESFQEALHRVAETVATAVVSDPVTDDQPPLF
jgi:hypothetical protein